MKTARFFVMVLVLGLLMTLGSDAGAQEPQLLSNGGCPPGNDYDPLCDVTRDGAINVLDVERVAARWRTEGLYTQEAYWSLAGNAGTTPGTHFLGTTDGQALIINPNGGNVGIGTTSPAVRLHVDTGSDNTIVALLDGRHPEGTALVMNGGNAGNVQLSLEREGSDWDWWIGRANGDDRFFIQRHLGLADIEDHFAISTNGNVGIGTPSPVAKLHVNAAGTNAGVYVESAGTDGVLVRNAGYSGFAVDNAGTMGLWVNNATANGVQVESAGQDGVAVLNAGASGVYVQSANNGLWVRDATQDGVAVLNAGASGVYVQSANNGLWVRDVASDGVHVVNATDDGVHVEAATDNGVEIINTGVDGVHIQSAGGHGVEVVNAGLTGIVVHAAGNLAGFFNGDVQVTGNLAKGSGAFKIDHPLDPENKYLYHSFVESPDMMNVYNGNVVLDKNGEAWVELPEWFEALNRDFRYQLTCIGGFAPVYIAKEIQNNRFKIAGGSPGLKVSWQVTGIRQDPYANAHRIPVEEEKPPKERGYYLHPDAYGQPEEKGIAWLKRTERLQVEVEREELLEGEQEEPLQANQEETSPAAEPQQPLQVEPQQP